MQDIIVANYGQTFSLTPALHPPAAAPAPLILIHLHHLTHSFTPLLLPLSPGVHSALQSAKMLQLIVYSIRLLGCTEQRRFRCSTVPLNSVDAEAAKTLQKYR